MRFDLSDVQASWRSKAELLGREIAPDAAAADAVMGAARSGLLDVHADLLSIAVAVETLASSSPSAAVAYAIHSVVMFALGDNATYGDLLARGERVGSASLSADEAPVDAGGRLDGRAGWVVPATETGVAAIGARRDGEMAVYIVPLDGPGVAVENVEAAGLAGLRCVHLELSRADAVRIGPTVPLMARARVLMAAVGLGIGARALEEALVAARASGGGAAGEQTVQGLLADAATALDAARLLTWEAAGRGGELTLGAASIAKLASTSAAQRAVEWATQVVGAETFRRGHVVERLAQEVRALELFAGRTESLRAAAAAELLPPASKGSGDQGATP